jgi:hypothetical protein
VGRTRARRAWLPLATALLLSAPPSRAADAAEGSRIREQVEVRLRTAKIRIVPSKRAAPGACSRLGTADLDVFLRGERVRDRSSIRLDRQVRPTLHAIVLDTSYSMGGRLEGMRAAVRAYVASFRPGVDRALVVTFDDSVVLAQGATEDLGAIARGIDAARLGYTTELLDAMYQAILELDTHRDRPVVVLLTDGIDTMSLHEREDVLRLAEARPDLTVFSISLGAPTLSGIGPSGILSSRSFLERIAERTNGEYFSTLTADALPRIYRRIRDVLDSEATLSVVDPDPRATRASLEVRSRVAECSVKVATQSEHPFPARAGIEGPPPALPQRLPIAPDSRLLALAPEPERAATACAAGTRLEVEAERIRGCYLDLAMQRGVLYEPFSEWRVEVNTWLDLAGRTLDMPVPAPALLPRGAEEVLDALADQAILAQASPAAPDPRKRDSRSHAVRYHDVPGLASGTALFDLRPRLAHALFLIPAYRSWAEAELPAHPSEADLARVLAAWLGDVPASELFARWEARSIERLVREGPDDPASRAFVDRWRALYRIFFAPSYARVLTLLAPIRDPAAERVGYWRIVLPRPGWILPRLQDRADHPDFMDLPMDLVPDRPFGYIVTRRLLEERPGLAAEVVAIGDLGGSVSYELLGKPRSRDPDRAFAHSRVSVKLGALRFAAEMEADRKGEAAPRFVAFDATESGALEPALREAAAAWVEERER